MPREYGPCTRAGKLLAGRGRCVYPLRMDPSPELLRVAKAIQRAHLEAVLFGDAAGALQGAEITPRGPFTFFVRQGMNARTIRQIAMDLRGQDSRSATGRHIRSSRVQVDFLFAVPGVKTFDKLRVRALTLSFDDLSILVADLRDLMQIKQVAMPRDPVGYQAVWLAYDGQQRAKTAQFARERAARQAAAAGLPGPTQVVT